MTGTDATGARVAGREVAYEVSLQVDAAIAGDYRAWLEGHVRDLLALPGFLGATVFEVLEPAEPGRTGLCVQYRMEDQAALDAYLRDHAPAMRAAGTGRFGGRFSASRRVLRPLPGADMNGEV